VVDEGRQLRRNWHILHSILVLEYAMLRELFHLRDSVAEAAFHCDASPKRVSEVGHSSRHAFDPHSGSQKGSAQGEGPEITQNVRPPGDRSTPSTETPSNVCKKAARKQFKKSFS